MCSCDLDQWKPWDEKNHAVVFWADLKTCARVLGSHAIPQPCSEKRTSMVNQCMSHSWWWQQLVRNRMNLSLAVRSFVRVAERTAIGTDSVTHSRIFKELPVSCEHGEPRGPMEVAWVVAVVAAWAAFFFIGPTLCCRHCKLHVDSVFSGRLQRWGH